MYFAVPGMKARNAPDRAHARSVRPSASLRIFSGIIRSVGFSFQPKHCFQPRKAYSVWLIHGVSV